MAAIGQTTHHILEKHYPDKLNDCTTLNDLLRLITDIHAFFPESYPLSHEGKPYLLKDILTHIRHYVESNTICRISAADLPLRFDVALKALLLKLELTDRRMKASKAKDIVGSPKVTFFYDELEPTEPSELRLKRDFPLKGKRDYTAEAITDMKVGFFLKGQSYPMERLINYASVKDAFVSHMLGLGSEFILINPKDVRLQSILDGYVERLIDDPMLEGIHETIAIVMQITKELLPSFEDEIFLSDAEFSNKTAQRGLYFNSEGNCVSQHVFDLADIVEHGEGCCRHHAHLNAFILGQLAILGHAPWIKNVHLFSNETDRGAHQVCTLETLTGDVYYIDSLNDEQPILLYTDDMDVDIIEDNERLRERYGEEFYEELVRRSIPESTLTCAVRKGF